MPSQKESKETTKNTFSEEGNQREMELQWQCRTCTFFNQALFLSCEMCGEPHAPESTPDNLVNEVAIMTEEVSVEGTKEQTKHIDLGDSIDIPAEQMEDVLISEEATEEVLLGGDGNKKQNQYTKDAKGDEDKEAEEQIKAPGALPLPPGRAVWKERKKNRERSSDPPDRSGAPVESEEGKRGLDPAGAYEKSKEDFVPPAQATWKQQKGLRQGRFRSIRNSEAVEEDPAAPEGEVSDKSSSIASEEPNSATDLPLVSRLQQSRATTIHETMERGEALLSNLVEAEEVPELVLATAAPDDAYLRREDIDRLLNELVAQFWQVRRKVICTAALIVLAILAIAGVIIGAVLGTRGESDIANDPGSMRPNGSEMPTNVSLAPTPPSENILTLMAPTDAPSSWSSAAPTGSHSAAPSSRFGSQPDQSPTNPPSSLPLNALTVLPSASPSTSPSDENEAGFSAAPTTNEMPVARCKQGRIVITSGAMCSLDSINTGDLDDGSFDPEGGAIELSVFPLGPYVVGSHFISLTVADNRGGRDSCFVNVVVTGEKSDWFAFQNHAYRIDFCESNWNTAKIFAEAMTQCGSQGHLATITSAEEQGFLRNLVEEQASARNRQFNGMWLGGFQPPGAEEPRGDWTWVNSEGQVYDGYTDWDEGEPNSGSEDCMIMLQAGRGHHWDDRPCSDSYWFLEEVDLEAADTIVVDGCDSGVPDRFDDVASCTYLIGPAMIDSCDSRRTSSDFDVCLETLLDPMLAEGKLSQLEKEQIMFCGVNNTPPVAACQDVVATADCGAEITSDPSNFDAQSVDADSDSLYFEVFPPGPYGTGVHEVTLSVRDGRGGSDTCQATLKVVDERRMSTPWVQFGESAYRLRLCAVDWPTALAFADETTHCGLGAHLATIQSEEERSFLQSMFGQNHWIGGFQPAKLEANGRSVQDCVLFSGDTVQWNDKNCGETRSYIEEIDLNDIGGCDTINANDIPVATRWIAFENHGYRFQLFSTDWKSAEAFANMTTHCGVRGHLATITSAEEQTFVKGLGVGDIWLGGF